MKNYDKGNIGCQTKFLFGILILISFLLAQHYVINSRLEMKKNSERLFTKGIVSKKYYKKTTRNAILFNFYVDNELLEGGSHRLGDTEFNQLNIGDTIEVAYLDVNPKQFNDMIQEKHFIGENLTVLYEDKSMLLNYREMFPFFVKVVLLFSVFGIILIITRGYYKRNE